MGIKKEISSSEITKTYSSNLSQLPQVMIEYIADYCSTQDEFFWKFGLVNQKILFIMKNLLIQRKQLVNLQKNHNDLLNNIKMIENVPVVADALAEVGLSLLSNININCKHIRSIVGRCPNLKLLDLNGCNVSELDMYIITTVCKELTHLSFGLCSNIKKRSIKTVSDNCRKLKMLQVPKCTKIRLHLIENDRDPKDISFPIFRIMVNDFDVNHNDMYCKPDIVTVYVFEEALSAMQIRNCFVIARKTVIRSG